MAASSVGSCPDVCEYEALGRGLRLYYQMTRGFVPWAHTGRGGGFLRSNHDLFHVPGSRLRQQERLIP